MQSQSNPREYDAVLGGQSVITAGAAVLGGAQGAVSRLKHGDFLAKRDALVYLEEKKKSCLGDDEVLSVLSDICEKKFTYDMNSAWFAFFDTASALYANAFPLRDDRFCVQDICVLGEPNQSILYALDDFHVAKYILVHLAPSRCNMQLIFDRPKIIF